MMFIKHAVLFVIVATITSSLIVSAKKLPPGCLANYKQCDTGHSEFCLSRYCHASRTCRTFGSTYDDSETTDHCAENPCPTGQICIWNTVQCIKAPCGPVYSCVDKSKTPCPT